MIVRPPTKNSSNCELDVPRKNILIAAEIQTIPRVLGM